MDLERHLRVLWRHRAIVTGGVLLGIATALLAAYQVGWNGGPSIERRGLEQWTSTSMVLVTQPGFPEGRVTLPMTNVPGGVAPVDPAAEVPEPSKGRLDFADPARFSNLALLYSVISYSDQVRKSLPGRPAAEQIRATPFDPTGRGDQFLPVIQLATTAATEKAAYDLNLNTVKGLRRLLVREQRANDIPDNQRVRLQVLNAPSPGLLVAGRSMTSSILAFVLCMAAALALAHLVEGLQLLRTRRTAEPEPEPVLEPISFDALELDLSLATANGPFNGDGNGDEPGPPEPKPRRTEPRPRRKVERPSA